MAFIISTTIMNTELKERLMLLAERYETPAFIVEDPIRIPHRYHSQTDVEISALVTSWIATGNRKAIIRSADRIDCAIFKNAPYQYIMSKEWRMYAGQKGSFYRYYSFDDFYLLCDTLYTVYSRKPTLEDTFMNRLRHFLLYKDYSLFSDISMVCPRCPVLSKLKRCACSCGG